MILPLFLILVAGLSGGIVAYGTDPLWMRYPHGLEIILWSRRLQWPLVALSLVACILLMGIAISGRRRAWWLIGLAPVLALFGHRFATGPAAGRMTVVENPPLVSVSEAKVADDEWVVGLTFAGATYAYPYSAIFSTPVILQADHDDRVILMWSAYANRVLAMPIGRELQARDLEVVSTPANALLIYNSRRGQFINGLTGQTTKHEKPIGFTGALPLVTMKMPWKEWRDLHPDTKVLVPSSTPHITGPTQPIEPIWPMPKVALDRPTDTRVAVIGAMHPIAVESASVTAAPLNSKADEVPIALVREQSDLPIRAFDRRTYDHDRKLDLIVELAPNFNHKRHPNAFFVDLGSNSGWSAGGVCVDVTTDGKFLKGRKLIAANVDDRLPLGVMKYWYPDLQLVIPPAAPIALESDHDPNEPVKRTSHRKPRKPKPAARATR